MVVIRVSELVKDVEGYYTSKYSGSLHPEDKYTAQSRLGYLHNVRCQIEAAFSELRLIIATCSLTPNEISTVKAPLNLLLAKVDQETFAVRLYIRNKNLEAIEAQTKNIAVLKLRVLKILIRVAQEGFVLTVDDQELLSGLQEEVGE